MREAWCLNTRIRKRIRGAAPACHLQPSSQTASRSQMVVKSTGSSQATKSELLTSLEQQQLHEHELLQEEHEREQQLHRPASLRR